jgi:hypothetical protein
MLNLYEHVFFLFLFDVWIQLRVWSILTFFCSVWFQQPQRAWWSGCGNVDVWTKFVRRIGARGHGQVREIGLYCTCWWYSLCNFQYRSLYENMKICKYENMKIHGCITLSVEVIRTCIFLCLFDVWLQLRVWSILTLRCYSRKQPCKVDGLGGHRLKQVCAGNEHTCVLSENGLVLVAGYNDNGQCGQGTTERVGKG